MNSKSFESINGMKLIVKNRKSAVIFEMEQTEENKEYKFEFEFDSKTWKDLSEYIETISNESWSGLTPKEADSFGADYCEYYDRQLDDNGCLSIQKNKLSIERPSLESVKLYQFNKRKIESFIYDLKKLNN